MSFAICTYNDGCWRIIQDYLPFLEDAKRYNPISRDRHFILSREDLEKNNRYPNFYMFYTGTGVWETGNPHCITKDVNGTIEIAAKFDSLLEATGYAGSQGMRIVPLSRAQDQNVPDTLEWNAEANSWKIQKGTDLFSQGWPQGREFTVALRVVDPGEMARFFTHSNDGSLLYGCVVTRVDFQDRVGIVEAKKARIAELLAELSTVILEQ